MLQLWYRNKGSETGYFNFHQTRVILYICLPVCVKSTAFVHKNNIFVLYGKHYSDITLFFCVVCPSSIYGFWFPIWYLQTLHTYNLSTFYPWMHWIKLETSTKMSQNFFLTFTSLGLVLLWQQFYLFCSSIVINTVIVTAGTFGS